MARPKPTRRETKPTTTTLVAAELERRDDFASVPQLALSTGRTRNQVSAALCHLKQHGVVDSVVSEGSLWWFLAGGDDRQRILAAITADAIVKTTRRRRPKDANT